ncbi:hypothetical protein I9W82_003168 [Candida metapsilosis]|uniref:J domain-containing protein n=1 Tax=Candida metapsilosis TaxID=273372 RepID=A0A8H7ZID8_9ASCO|nr:hypothetical protein I9W82_003168 [Candida metapsilosis]
MMVSIRHLLTFIAFCNYSAIVACSKLSPSDVLGKIAEVETLFTKEGPTPIVLDHFDHVIKDVRLYSTNEAVELGQNELNKSLTQLLFKRALIEISLKKEALAIVDLQDVLKLDPLMKPAENKLVEILVSRGDFANLEQYLKDANISTDSPVWEPIHLFQHHWTQAEKLFKENKFEECLKELNQVAVVSNNNYDVYELYLKASLEMFQNDPQKKIQYLDEPEVQIKKVIVSLLVKLLKINPVRNLQYYTLLSEFYLITEVQFDQAFKTVKNCLRIDNDFKPCGELSKFYSKFATFLQDLENYSINNGHIYPKLELEHQGNFDKELAELNFKQINDFLFHEDVKLTRVEQKKSLKVKTNFDYLIKVKELGHGLSNKDLLFYSDLTKLACESFIQIGDYKNGKDICKLVKDKEFFPIAVPEIDQLLKKKDYQGAERILSSFNGFVKNTPLYKEKTRPVEEYKAKINQERQRQQQQQQQNFFRQQQQQQQQQQRQQYQQFRQPQSKPKTDYYKILDIGRDADDKTIRKAYRTQTLKYHPDKYKGSDLTPEQIEHKMQDVNKAYEVLSDPELRERYDRGDDPHDPLSGGAGGGQPQWSNGGGQQFSFNFGNGGGFAGGGGGDFFQQFFGGMGGGGGGAGNPFGTHHKVKIKKNKKTKKRN